MTERIEKSTENDEAIWRDAVTLSPAQTKDAKVHVTLRLDPNVYRAILAEKKAMKDRTITATIERVLDRGLQSGETAPHGEADAKLIHAALRNLVAHSAVQDAVLEVFTRHLKPRSSQDRRLVDEFRKHSRHRDVDEWVHDYSESTEYRNLMHVLFDIPLPEREKRARELPGQPTGRARRRAS